jgi:multidrug efflux pump subunit AcrA (membrane-fusion protein)
LSWLKKGHDVKIIIDETGDELNAKIISLGAAVDAASQTIELKAQFNEKYESLIPGMSGIVKF